MPDARAQPDDFDFEGEMKSLASQAQAKPSSNGSSRADRHEMLLAVGQLIRPLALELESLKRSNTEQSTMLVALGKIINHPPASPQSAALETISQQMQRLNSVESANSKLFDALHAELKGYKDNFLFDALQKPFIRDLVSLFDDLSAMHDQIVKRLTESGKGNADADFLRTLAGNAENQVHHMIEVFLRMDVILSKTAVGAPVDKKTHRVVSFEPAASQDEDGVVARSMRPGFFWRDRPIRAEEIVARRWKAPVEPAPGTDPAHAETVLISPKAA